MNPILWEIIFNKKGSLFGFGRGSKQGTFDGMRGYKTWKDTYIIKENGVYKTIDRTWDDSQEIFD